MSAAVGSASNGPVSQVWSWGAGATGKPWQHITNALFASGKQEHHVQVWDVKF